MFGGGRRMSSMGDDGIMHKIGAKIGEILEDADDMAPPDAALVAYAEGTEEHGEDHSPAAKEPQGD